MKWNSFINTLTQYFITEKLGYTLIRPWGFIQGLFKKQSEKSLLPFVVKPSDTEEHDMSLIQKKLKDLESLPLSQRVEHLEKLILFFEDYVIKIPLLDFVKNNQQHQQEDEKNNQQYQQQ